MMLISHFKCKLYFWYKFKLFYTQQLVSYKTLKKFTYHPTILFSNITPIFLACSKL